MQLISEFKIGICFLLCAIDIFSKYASVVPLKNTKCITILMFLNKYQMSLTTNQTKNGQIKEVSYNRSNYNRSMKSLLQVNDIEMYSTGNEWKSLVAERFIRTLKTKIQKCMTSISNNMYID